MYSMSHSLNHFVCEHGLHWTEHLNLFIMDRKCQSNVTIRPGLIWPSCPVTRWPMSSSRMRMGESDDGLITSTRNEIPSSISKQIAIFELHTTSDSFIITMFGVVQQWILTRHRIYWNYLSTRVQLVSPSYHPRHDPTKCFWHYY